MQLAESRQVIRGTQVLACFLAEDARQRKIAEGETSEGPIIAEQSWGKRAGPRGETSI